MDIGKELECNITKYVNVVSILTEVNIFRDILIINSSMTEVPIK